MKINFININLELDKYGSNTYKYSSIDIITYKTDKDYMLLEETSDFTINLKDRFISKTDYLLRDTLEESLNIVYDDDALNSIKEILGESHTRLKIYSIVDMFAWCINNNKIGLYEVEDISTHISKGNISNYKISFEIKAFSKIYKYIDEYISSPDSYHESESEHFLLDLELDTIPVNFLNRIKLKSEDRVYIFDRWNSRPNFNMNSKSISFDEMKVFLRIAGQVEVKERIREDFLSNILLHILQNNNIKKYTIISRINEIDNIVCCLRKYLGDEYNIYGLYSDYIGAISPTDLNDIIIRSDNAISFLHELKQSIGERYALILFKSSLQNFYMHKIAHNSKYHENISTYTSSEHNVYDDTDNYIDIPIDVLGILDDDDEDL